MKSPERWRTGASPGGKMTQRSPLSTSRGTEDPLSRDPLTTFHTVSLRTRVNKDNKKGRGVAARSRVASRAGRPPLGYRTLSLDHQGTVARFPSAGFVSLLQPVGDDGLTALHDLLAPIVGVVGVGGILREEGSYGRGVVSAPGVHVGVDPPLHGVVGQDAPSSATLDFSYLIALIILTASGLTVTPYELSNILCL